MFDGIVGRAELKLSEAVKDFRYNMVGKTVLDIGSSTGGFTELSLRLGAKKVIAVEKGSFQMKPPLCLDPRIDLHEKTDIFDVVARDSNFFTKNQREDVFVINDKIDVILADVSFVSLTKVLIYAYNYLANPDTDFLVMLKPQFEAQDKQLRKGVVKNERVRREIIKVFERFVQSHGFLIVKKHDNNLAGKNGNREKFYWLKMAGF